MADEINEGDGYTINGERHPYNWANHPDSVERFKRVTVTFTDGALLEIISDALFRVLPAADQVREFVHALSEFRVHNPLIPARGYTVSSMDHGGAFGVVTDDDTEARDGKLYIPVCFAPGADPVMVEMNRLTLGAIAS